ncbi:hypothetical protein [Nostoc sp.]|uniref:hypothetical protein n=1 Tax=Nostoc sp. TaxID=1180 RepID=UPI002FF6F291
MATIAISNLRAPGAELFMDSESYLSELTDTEIDGTKGGITPAVFLGGVAVGYAISKGWL